MGLGEEVVISERIDTASLKKYAPFFVMPLLGLFFCAYALTHFYSVKLAQGESFACNINQTFNCDTVALSAWSELFGVPMGVYGAAYFVALWILLGIGISAHKGARDHLLAYVAMNVLGVMVSLVLAGISHFVLHTWCISCMGIYAVCLLQLLLLLWQRDKFDFKFDVAAITRGGTTALVVVVASVALHSFAKPRPSRPVPPIAENDSSSAAEMLLASGAAQTIPLNRTPYAGLGEDYRLGSDQAQVRVVEFIDFQCPSCQRMSAALEVLHKEYGERVLFVVKNFPLDKKCHTSMSRSMHEHACNIAVLARCAGQFGKFWQYHDLAFAAQQDAGEATMVAWAKQVGLSEAQISSCRDSRGILDKIKDDIALGSKIGVEGTPAVFINGKKYLGAPQVETLRRAIDSVLN